MRRRGAPTAFCSLGLALLAQVAPRVSRDLLREERELPRFVGEPAVTADELEGHVRFLASDELAGRDTGSPGSLRAAEYIARELALGGVRPGGAEGFFQRVPLERAVYDARPVLEVRTRDGEFLAAEYGADFRVGRASALDAVLAVRAVGPDDELPAEARPDLALFFDEPRSRVRRRLASAGHSEGAGFGLLLVASDAERGRVLGAPEPRLGPPAPPPPGPPEITLRGEWSERFRSGSALQVRVALNRRTEPVDAFNLVGRVPARPGSPTADETVLLTAHYDHVGVREAGGEPEEDEDRIYNGADDDASGVATVLEIAEAVAAGPAPERALLVLLLTGEERGHLGTHHYLEHPLAPLARTVANLNFEMVGRPDALVGGAGVLWLTGWERTNLGPAFAEEGLSIVADARPEQRFFQRSDNYPFARRGVVAQTLSSFALHEDYHRVTDEADRLDYAHMQRAARSALAAVRLPLEGTLRPEWLPGGRPE